MKLLVAIAFISVVSSQPSPYHKAVGIPRAIHLLNTESTRIGGGHNGLRSLSPHMGGVIITLASNATSICGSSLLSNTRSLTAARCWNDGHDQAVQFELVFNSLTLFEGGTRVVTRDVVLHEDYDTATYSDDIAVIRIPWVDYTGNLYPINLPVLSLNESFDGTEALVDGFGSIDYAGNGGGDLMYAFAKLISNEKCSETYGSAVTERVICSEGMYSVSGPCTGDYGGALHSNTFTIEGGFKNVLLGVISHGPVLECQNDAPFMHTRVTEYVDWIQQKMN